MVYYNYNLLFIVCDCLWLNCETIYYLCFLRIFTCLFCFVWLLVLQIVIDSCCATFAEVQKRGKDFWAEFELYAADLLVGIVVDIALVGMLAPYARIGKPSVVSRGVLGRIQRFTMALPSRWIVRLMLLTLTALLKVIWVINTWCSFWSYLWLVQVVFLPYIIIVIIIFAYASGSCFIL